LNTLSVTWPFIFAHNFKDKNKRFLRFTIMPRALVLSKKALDSPVLLRVDNSFIAKKKTSFNCTTAGGDERDVWR